jgi:hypothetical protein
MLTTLISRALSRSSSKSPTTLYMSYELPELLDTWFMKNHNLLNLSLVSSRADRRKAFGGIAPLGRDLALPGI